MRYLEAVGTRRVGRCLAAPDPDLHAEHPAVGGHLAADASVAPDAQALSTELLADVPLPRAWRMRLASSTRWRRLASASAQLSSAVAGPCAAAFGHEHAARRAGRHVDMARELAGLADQSGFGRRSSSAASMRVRSRVSTMASASAKRSASASVPLTVSLKLRASWASSFEKRSRPRTQSW